MRRTEYMSGDSGIPDLDLDGGFSLRAAHARVGPDLGAGEL